MYYINGPKVVREKPTLWVVDNFYDNPDAIREYALRQVSFTLAIITEVGELRISLRFQEPKRHLSPLWV